MAGASSDPNEGGQQGGGNPARGRPRPAETALMVAGGVVTLVLFSYAAWHAVAVPAGGPPEATVVGTRTLENDSVAVRVRLHVSDGAGLISATVSSSCDTPAPEVTFSNLPGDSTWTGTLVCPPGTTDPSVQVSTWVEA